MKATKPVRLRETVYVVGAGFSAGLGYPLTNSLLIQAWSRLESDSRKQLQRIIEFHHPDFNTRRRTTFPDIEQLLTEIEVNLDLFDASRPVEGTFTRDDLLEAREGLLSTIAEWFHELYEDVDTEGWLSKFVKRLENENAAVISFNWDLLLDHLLFHEELSSEHYGLNSNLADGPILVKPHGSLNWYEATQIKKVAATKRTTIFPAVDGDRCIEAFLPPRGIVSKSGRRYTPLIIPPTYLKNFRRRIFRQLWNSCTDLLSTPKKLVFLGYSLPTADLHAQFIFRCGFHNQLDGRLKKDGARYPATGAAQVVIVNPDQAAARRIEAVAGAHIPCRWIPKRIEEWIEDV